MTRRLMRGSFIAAAALPFALAPGRVSALGERYTMRVSITQSATSVGGVVLTRLAAAIARRSNGQLNIELYPSGQIAKEQESIDALATGTLGLASMSTSWLVQLYPRWQIFDMPFLVQDTAAAYRVMDGPVGQSLFAELETRGLVGLAWGASAFKEIETTAKVIIKPEDMKGMRFRAVPGAIPIATYRALGALPVAIDASEITTALTQRAIEGMDPPLEAVVSFRFYTVIKHIAMSNHVLVVLPLFASKKQVEALPANLQRILREEAKAIVPFWRSLYAKTLAENTELLKQNGVAFTDPDHAAFRKAVDPVYAGIESRPTLDLIDQVARTAGPVRR